MAMEIAGALLPDIHELFCHYNDLYFQGVLGACIVSWSSTSPMESCTGTFECDAESGACEIRLSEPLLKGCSDANLKNTLLREMIHAYLWIEKRIRDHRDHKVAFLSVMDAINTSPLLDHQKPPVGYNISIYHNFTKEADINLANHWTCELCQHSFWRSMRGEPSAKDCIGKFNTNNSCGYPVCQWHRHRNQCSGRYIKSQDEVPGYQNEITGNANSKPSGDGSASEQMLEDSKGKGLAVFATRKRTRPLELVMKPADTGKRRKRCSERKAYNVIIQWLDLYTDEEEEEEEVPLVNKRTERRRKMRLLDSQAESIP